MILISDAKGNLKAVNIGTVNQGSSDLNEVYLFAPFNSAMAVYVSFKLPNGLLIYPKLAKNSSEIEDADYGYTMTPLDGIDGAFFDKDGNIYNAWYILLDAPLTEFSGTLTYQLRGVIGTKIISFSEVRIQIQNGVPYLDPTITESDINTISAWLAAAEQAANNAEQAANNAEQAANNAEESAKYVASAVYSHLKFGDITASDGTEYFACLGFDTDKYETNEIESMTAIAIPAVYEGKAVTGIYEAAFLNCLHLKEVFIPDSVARISYRAFEGCTNLTNVTFGNGLKILGGSTFKNCTNLTSVVLPEGLTNIGDNAFDGCSSLQKVSLPNTLVNIGGNIFLNCRLAHVKTPTVTLGNATLEGHRSTLKTLEIMGDSFDFENGDIIKEWECLRFSELEEVIIKPGVKRISAGAFNECYNLKSVTIPDTVTEIGAYAFANCVSLKSITLPESLRRLGVPSSTSEGKYDGWTFYISPETLQQYPDNPGIERITIPSQITDLGKCTFENCKALKSVRLNEGLQIIREYAFKNCSSLTSIVIPETVYQIGSLEESVKSADVFEYCTSLESITVPFIGCRRDVGDTQYLGYWFGASSATDQADYVPASLKDVTITNDPEVRDYAFYGITSITSVRIAQVATYIGEYAFAGCTGLTYLNLGNRLRHIKQYAFSGCTKLLDTILPANMAYIEQYAFENCKSITGVFLPDNIFLMGENIFLGCTSIKTLRVPWNKEFAISEKRYPWGLNENQLTDVWFDEPDPVLKSPKGGVEQTINGGLRVIGKLTVDGDTETIKATDLLVKNRFIVCNVNDEGVQTSSGLVMITGSGNTDKSVNPNTVYPAYGIIYDEISDSVRLGAGYVSIPVQTEHVEDITPTFVFADGEDQAVATRADSIPDGHLVKWDAEKKTFVDLGISPADIIKILAEKVNKPNLSEDADYTLLAMNGAGTVTGINYSDQITKNTVAQRDASGGLKAEKATGDEHYLATLYVLSMAQTMSYVDGYTSASRTYPYRPYVFAAKGWSATAPDIAGTMTDVPTDPYTEWYQKVVNAATTPRTFVVSNGIEFGTNTSGSTKITYNQCVQRYTDKVSFASAENDGKTKHEAGREDLTLIIAPLSTINIRCRNREGYSQIWIT